MIKSCTFYGHMDPINYKKPMGFFNSFVKKNIKIDHMKDGNYGCSSKTTDLLFGESHDLTCDFSKNKFVVFWDNIEINKIKQIAHRFSETIFVIATKSWIFDHNINSSFCSKYDNKYAYFNRENIYFNLSHIEENIKNNIIDRQDNLYKLSDNLYLTYLPCSLSEDSPCDTQNREYDVVYIGSTHNRPFVSKAIDFLKNKYNIFSTYEKKIGPEEAINIYEKSKVAIHEQVSPVLLEHPVRLGECRRKGCSFVSLSEFVLPNQTQLIPDFHHCSNYDVFVETIEQQINSFNAVPYTTNTYDNALEFILKILQRVSK